MNLCLTMLREGLAGETDKGLAKALGQSGDVAALRDAYRQQRKNFTGYARIANLSQAIFVSQQVPPNPAFVDSVKKGYDAEVKATDFPEPGTGQINAWAKQKTDGRIEKIVDRLDPATMLVLLQATVFQDKWEKPFDPANTKDADFSIGRGRAVACRMMSRSGDVLYGSTDTFQAIRLPYTSGFSMVIVLPKQGKSFAQAVADPAFADSIGGRSLVESDGTVQIPKWTKSSDHNLKPVLTAWGANRLFEPSKDFDGVGQDAFVSFVKQSAWIQVDEEGTKAAAVTSVGVEAAAAPAEPFQFRADRPFIYAILTPGGEPLFIGTITDPRN